MVLGGKPCTSVVNYTEYHLSQNIEAIIIIASDCTGNSINQTRWQHLHKLFFSTSLFHVKLISVPGKQDSMEGLWKPR